MPRYAALLRGVSPMNAKMPELRAAFEHAGFEDVKTVLSSGNVVFEARSTSPAKLARRAEEAMDEVLGRTFPTIVRRVDALRALLEKDPYSAFGPQPADKRMVSFLPAVRRIDGLPTTVDGCRILHAVDAEVFGVYAPGNGPAFMKLVEKTLGKEVTTRTWETVKKIVR